MRVVGVKRAFALSLIVSGPALSFFSYSDQLALASSKRSDKSTGCWPRTPSVARERVFRSRLRHYGDGIVPLLRSVARAHFIDCGFDARRTSHPVAVPKNGWHHNPSFAGSSGSGGRVHTVCRHITATVCDGPPARIQRG